MTYFIYFFLKEVNLFHNAHFGRNIHNMIPAFIEFFLRLTSGRKGSEIRETQLRRKFRPKTSSGISFFLFLGSSIAFIWGGSYWIRYSVLRRERIHRKQRKYREGTLILQIMEHYEGRESFLPETEEENNQSPFADIERWTSGTENVLRTESAEEAKDIFTKNFRFLRYLKRKGLLPPPNPDTQSSNYTIAVEESSSVANESNKK